MSLLDDLIESEPGQGVGSCSTCELGEPVVGFIAEFISRLDSGDPKLHGWAVTGTRAKTRSLQKLLQKAFDFPLSRHRLGEHVNKCVRGKRKS